MELEFESRAVQWYGCLVHRADTEEERERERERERELPLPSTLLLTIVVLLLLFLRWPAAVLFCSATVAMAAAICRRRLLLSPHSILTYSVSDSVGLAYRCSHLRRNAMFDGRLNRYGNKNDRDHTHLRASYELEVCPHFRTCSYHVSLLSFL